MHIELSIPGSKSISNRILLLKAISKNKIKIENLADCTDTKEMLKNLKLLQNQKADYIKLNTGEAGTTTRFLTALCALSNKNIILDGSKRMRKRPLKPLINALKKLGADIQHNSGFLPLKFSPVKLKGGKIYIDGSVSSQFLSAILMIAPFIKGKTEIIVKNKPCSIPYIKMTINLMEKFGLKVHNNKFKKFTIKGEQTALKLKKFIVEPDASSASYMGAFTAINPGVKILLKNIKKDLIQGDIKFLRLLEKMGCNLKEINNGTIIKGPKKLKSPGEIDMNKTPDLVMTFAVLSIFTEGFTTITNISNLRVKECDRLNALKRELNKIGIKTIIGKDWIKIKGNPNLKIKEKINIKTYNDHRIAMSFGILTYKYPSLKILFPECVSKSYPGFWKDLNKLKNHVS